MAVMTSNPAPRHEVPKVPLCKGGPAQQAALARRLEGLLAQLCERFRGYLDVLEKQQALIESGSEDILVLVGHEEQSIAGILSVQKVIEPLEDMYNSAVNPFSEGILALQAELEGLKTLAKAQSKRNRDLLSVRMAVISAQISTLRNNPLAIKARRAMKYSAGASLIDITG